MKIILVSSSIRNNRNSHGVALFLQQKLYQNSRFESSIIDLKEEKFPLDEQRYIDFIDPPASLKAASAKLRSADGLFSSRLNIMELLALP